MERAEERGTKQEVRVGEKGLKALFLSSLEERTNLLIQLLSAGKDKDVFFFSSFFSALYLIFLKIANMKKQILKNNYPQKVPGKQLRS